ncbi:MAG: lamin tail domain-containing protein [bacterium]|nr:lamin tail domain-containing protein [bacterium]
MRHLVVSMLFTAACIQIHAQLTVNEVHPTPAAGEPEWIECVNTTSRWINISNWYVCDNRSCCVVPADTRIPPYAYVVLTRDSAALREARPLPADAVLIEAKLPSLNNTIDEVYLRNSDSTLVDSIGYTMAWGRKGLTLERAVANGQNTWSASLASDSATCGYLNSVVRLEYDLRIAEIRAGKGTLDVVVVNHGKHTSSVRGCSMLLEGLEYSELQANIPGLLADELYVWSIDIEVLHSLHPQLQIDVEAVFDGADDRSENDALRRMLTLPPIINTVTITEIMFDPFETQADYVEICNAGTDTIDLDGWYIMDGVAGVTEDRTRATINASLVLRPGEYGVVLMDTLRSSMMLAGDRKRSYICTRGINANANGDALALYTSSGFLVDSVLYTSDMHAESVIDAKGIALEKLNPKLAGLAPSSWTSSGNLKGGTPARANSVQIEVPITTSLAALPSPFSSIQGTRFYPCVIAFQQPFLHAIVGLRICTPDGHHVRWLLNAVFAGSDGLVVWDGTDDLGRRVKTGPYVATLEVADTGTSRIHNNVAVVVVGE